MNPVLSDEKITKELCREDESSESCGFSQFDELQTECASNQSPQSSGEDGLITLKDLGIQPSLNQTIQRYKTQNVYQDIGIQPEPDNLAMDQLSDESISILLPDCKPIVSSSFSILSNNVLECEISSDDSNLVLSREMKKSLFIKRKRMIVSSGSEHSDSTLEDLDIMPEMERPTQQFDEILRPSEDIGAGVEPDNVALEPLSDESLSILPDYKPIVSNSFSILSNDVLECEISSDDSNLVLSREMKKSLFIKRKRMIVSSGSEHSDSTLEDLDIMPEMERPTQQFDEILRPSEDIGAGVEPDNVDLEQLSDQSLSILEHEPIASTSDNFGNMSKIQEQQSDDTNIWVDIAHEPVVSDFDPYDSDDDDLDPDFIPTTTESGDSTVSSESENIDVGCNETHQFIRVGTTTKKNKEARVSGKSYIGYKKIGSKLIPCIEKPARLLKPRCLHTRTDAKTKNSFLCGLISDDERAKIHSDFWNLKTWDEKKTFIKASAIRRGIRRRRRTNNLNKKQSGHDIYINRSDVDCSRVKVCRLFFLNTLCLGEDTFRRWTREGDIIQDDPELDSVAVNPNSTLSTSRSIEHTLPRSLLRNIVKLWLDLLPKVPSHYCRASSSKSYVESTFRSELHMFGVFKEWCQENDHQAASRKTFLKVLKQENIAIHQPRKDQCDTCCSYKTGNISQQEYEQHVEKKNEAREAKKRAVSSASTKVVTITVDVQSVLLAPKLLASALYYKCKLQCHNFTVYDVSTKKVTIYFWHEADGNVTANEFTSCLIDYIQNLPPETEKVVVISDGCCHQNRNRVLSSALNDLSQKNAITIEQLYLEKGHTMMEVDSVHSTIEQYIKPPIYAPSDYITRIRQARPQQPYEIKSIHYDFFLNYEEVPSNFKSIRPGKKKGDPVVVDIRGLKYSTNGTVEYKLRHTHDWTDLPQRRIMQRQPRTSINRLYLQPLKITYSKFKHLQELKEVIDKDYHPFYDSLTFIPNT